MAIKKTHAIFVLDRSGSMMSCRDATISGFNEQVNALANGAARVWITTIIFDQHLMPSGPLTDLAANGINLDVLFERKRASEAPHLTAETYVPRGGTPMLDAVGKAIAIGDWEKKADSILVMTFSDGEENASKSETWTTIAEKIKARTATGKWTFGYVGANQDLSVVAKRINIPFANTLNYVATDGGTRAMYASSAGATSTFAASAGNATATLFSDNNTSSVVKNPCTCAPGWDTRHSHQPNCPQATP